MNLKYSVLIASGVFLASAAAYSVSSPDRRRFLVQSASSVASSALPFVVPPAMAEGDDDGFTTTESGLRYKVITEGTGAIPSPGQTVKAHYTGMFCRIHLHCIVAGGMDSPLLHPIKHIRLVGWI
jgi:hypothetical protein